MALFDDVFNKASIHQMLFFNIKSVLIYPTLTELQAKSSQMYERWKYISKVKYNCDMDVIHGVAGTLTDETPQYAQRIYHENAIQYPEFSKIVAITYANVYNEGAELKRHLKKIANESEAVIIEQFMYLLEELSGDDSKSSPQSFSILCGHNIISRDIPLLIKRFLYYRKDFQTIKTIPYILKRALTIKPWESGIIDTVNVWKFNGFDYSPLMLISDFLGLKKTTDLISNIEISDYYWKNIQAKPIETLEYVALQSAIQTNLVIQFMIEMRLV